MRCRWRTHPYLWKYPKWIAAIPMKWRCVAFTHPRPASSCCSAFRATRRPGRPAMSEEFKTSFLTYYIHSLGERTREEKKGTKFGFDWIIYNLALAEDWSPHRLPFLRAGGSETSMTKSELGFGVDLAFLSADQQTLRMFVLKYEVLNNTNWGTKNFDIDLRHASPP